MDFGIVVVAVCVWWRSHVNVWNYIVVCYLCAQCYFIGTRHFVTIAFVSLWWCNIANRWLFFVEIETEILNCAKCHSTLALFVRPIVTQEIYMNHFAIFTWTVSMWSCCVAAVIFRFFFARKSILSVEVKQKKKT